MRVFFDAGKEIVMEDFEKAVEILQELVWALQGKESPCDFIGVFGCEYSDSYYKTQPEPVRKKHILPPIRADPMYRMFPALCTSTIK